MLELKNVYLTLENNQNVKKSVLHNINMKFWPGKLYGVTGPNGSGKTSLAKVIMGIFPTTQGEILLNGKTLNGLNVSERAQRGISYGFQQPPRFKGVTVHDMLSIAGGYQEQEKELRLKIREVGLCPEDYFPRDLDSSLSGGEMKRIEMAQILLRDSQVSIFDEPEAGVDLWTMQKIVNILIRNYKNNHERIAIIITHNENILPICDEIIVLEAGQVSSKGSAQAIFPLIKTNTPKRVTMRPCQEDIRA